MVIRELNKEEFKSFIDEFPFNSIYQTIEYGEAMRLNGYEVLYFGVVEGQKIIALHRLNDASLLCVSDSVNCRVVLSQLCRSN